MYLSKDPILFTSTKVALAKGKSKVGRVIEVLTKMRRARSLQGLAITKDFRGFIKTSNGSGKKIRVTEFGLLCLNPSYMFKKLLEDERPRSVILTSGTLAPLNLL